MREGVRRGRGEVDKAFGHVVDDLIDGGEGGDETIHWWW